MESSNVELVVAHKALEHLRGITKYYLVDEENEQYFRSYGNGWFVTLHEGAMWAVAVDLPITKSFIKAMENMLEEGKLHLDNDLIKVFDLFGFQYAAISGQFFINWKVKHATNRNAYIFHAIRFPDGRQWDAFNGWRDWKMK